MEQNNLYEKWGHDNVIKTQKLVNFLLEHKNSSWTGQSLNLLLFNGTEKPIKIREYINIARNWKYGIIAGKLGYKLTTNRTELKKYIESRLNELASEKNTLNLMSEWYNKI